MGTPHSSVELRSRVDAAIHPQYEHAFDVLDALLSQLAAGTANHDHGRIIELRATLAEQLAHLDHPRR